MPGVVTTDEEFVRFGLRENFFNNFCGAISCSIIPTSENVWVPEPDGNASNSS